MTYTCFPNQTPFPLPPGVTTPPTSPTFTDNGPQTPPNSVEASDDLDLCSLVGLLDSLPDDEPFIPELADPDTPILPPYQETFVVDAPVRLTGAWFFIPGAARLDQGSFDLAITSQMVVAQLVTSQVTLSAEAAGGQPFATVEPVVRAVAAMGAPTVTTPVEASVRIEVDVLVVPAGGTTGDSLGFESGMTLTAT
jgi:hypothetical protein